MLALGKDIAFSLDVLRLALLLNVLLVQHLDGILPTRLLVSPEHNLDEKKRKMEGKKIKARRIAIVHE